VSPGLAMSYWLVRFMFRRKEAAETHRDLTHSPAV
jgi:hypothetical protein